MHRVCPLPGCGKVLSCSYRLKTHIERHHQGIRKYECPECFKLFKSRDNLHDHLTRHPRPVEVDQGLLEAFRLRGFTGQLVVPKLTDMVERSSDPDLRPFTVVRRVYPYPVDGDEVVLPAIEKREGVQS